jgi:hypothetical protein
MKIITIKNIQIQVDALDENHERQINKLIETINRKFMKINGSPAILTSCWKDNVPEYDIEELCDDCANPLKHYMRENKSNPLDKSLVEVYGCPVCETVIVPVW